jgi:hypothetical protein
VAQGAAPAGLESLVRCWHEFEGRVDAGQVEEKVAFMGQASVAEWLVTAKLRYMYERGRSGVAGAERHSLGSMCLGWRSRSAQSLARISLWARVWVGCVIWGERQQLMHRGASAAPCRASTNFSAQATLRDTGLSIGYPLNCVNGLWGTTGSAWVYTKPIMAVEIANSISNGLSFASPLPPPSPSSSPSTLPSPSPSPRHHLVITFAITLAITLAAQQSSLVEHLGHATVLLLLYPSQGSVS